MSGLAECLKTANRSYVFTLVTFYPFDDNLKRRKASEGRRYERKTYLRRLGNDQLKGFDEILGNALISFSSLRQLWLLLLLPS